MIGTTLSHYRITGELGRGGMGIVYQAEDTKLDRTVAIKILPSAALASSDDRERFYREAKSAAQLHHPNIASVFEIDEAVPEGGDAAEPRPFIAMEYIAGGTLQDKIKEKPLSLPDAVKIASQVAEALKAAHAKDIVHRDIKSANVMITEDGVAKVLDFGLAKTNQSTMLTRMGSTLGTVAYMSPEQARGQEVDGRTDLYSLGTMLYEMVAGRLPFAGEYEQAVVYSILNEPPEPLTSLRTGVPMQLEWIVNKLLAKDADYRYQTAADLLADLKALDLSGSGMSRRSMAATSAASIPMVEAASPSNKPAWMWPALVVFMALVAAGAWFLRPSPAGLGYAVPAVFTLDTEDGWDYRIAGVSSSGRYVALFRRSDQQGIEQELVLRDLKTGEERIVLEQQVWQVSFSPDDSQMLMDADEGVYRAGVTGGAPVKVSGRSWNATFLDSDRVIFTTREGIRVTDLDGRSPTWSVPSDSARYFESVQWLEGSTVLAGMVLGENQPAVVMLDLETSDFEMVLNDAWPLGYVDSGHLIYLTVENENAEAIVARPFDLDARQFSGPSVRLFDDPSSKDWAFRFNFRDVLAWKEENRNFRQEGLFWVEPDGEMTSIDAPQREYGDLDLSPDGTMLVVNSRLDQNENQEDLFAIDVDTGNLTRLTFNGDGSRPSFSSDGSMVYFDGTMDGRDVLMVKPSDGSQASALLDIPGSTNGGSRRWVRNSPDGDLFAWSNRGSNDTEIRSVSDSTRWQIIKRGEATIPGPFSPDGRFIALAVGEGTRQEVQVQEVFGDAYWTVSLPEHVWATFPRWSDDGRWLYFLADRALWGAEVRTIPTFSRERPREIIPSSTGMRYFDVHPDGNRFIVTAPIGDPSAESEGGSNRMRVNLQAWLNEIAPSTE